MKNMCFAEKLGDKIQIRIGEILYRGWGWISKFFAIRMYTSNDQQLSTKIYSLEDKLSILL